MNAARQTRVAKAWALGQRTWWAFGVVRDTCTEKPKQAWPLINTLLRVAITKELIQDLGAGPLEDFIRSHGEKYIDKIEALAARSERFRRALRIVWIRELSKDLTRRLVALGCQDLEALRKKKKRKVQQPQVTPRKRGEPEAERWASQDERYSQNT